MNKPQKYLLLFLAMGMSFVLSHTLNKNLFANNSPQFSEKAIAFIKGKDVTVASNGGASIKPAEDFSGLLAKTVLKPMTKGVYASSGDKGIKVVEIKEGEMNYKKLIIKKDDGTTFELKYPANSPLSRKMIEYLQKN